MELSKEDVSSITQSVWTTVLGLKARDERVRGALPSGALGASVQIRGGWSGELVLMCSQRLARRAAGIVFDVPPDGASGDDVSDALGELANMIGGSVKALLAEGASLSVPIVRPYDSEPRTEKGMCAVTFDCEGERLAVFVLEIPS